MKPGHKRGVYIEQAYKRESHFDTQDASHVESGNTRCGRFLIVELDWLAYKQHR